MIMYAVVTIGIPAWCKITKQRFKLSKGPHVTVFAPTCRNEQNGMQLRLL